MVKKPRIEAASTNIIDDFVKGLKIDARKCQGASQEASQSVVQSQHEELAKERLQEISSDFLAGSEAESISFEKSTTL